MEQHQEKDIQDYLIALRKRIRPIVVIFSIIVILTTSIAFLLPSVYKSSSTILIEQQEIPRELVMSTVTSYAAERIQKIQARVMTRTNLLRIVEKFNLYASERKVKTSSEIVAKMIEDVNLEIISAEVVDPRTGRPSAATIAFSLSFKGEEPAKVQKVANELTTLYLDENITNRKQKATETAKFFEFEKDKLTEEIRDLETKLAEFKQEYSESLPEQQALNLQILQRKESELLSIDTKLRSLDERKFYLVGQLAMIDPGNPAVPGASSRLKALQAEYAAARARYSDEHPDVIRLKNEIDSLKVDASGESAADVIAEQLKILEQELARKQQQYTAEHPDVIALQSKKESLKKELATARQQDVNNYYESEPDNPAYISTRSQLVSVESEIKSLRTQREQTVAKITEIERALYESPQVEREYLKLRRDYEGAVLRYNQTTAKQATADVARQLESDSKGERFTLIDPAILPEEPVSPNRPAIVFIGIVLGFVCAIGFAIVADAISGTVRGVRGMQRILGVAPLAVIPYEMNLADRARSIRIKKRVVILFIAVILFALIFIHFFMSPLDVMWYRFLRKVDTMML